MDIYERKLMLVDDNQELLEMIADILRHSGYKNIVKAKCVQEALTVFQMEKPDMAVLDVMLPDGDGFQLFQKLRENSEIPILFLSARDGHPSVRYYKILINNCSGARFQEESSIDVSL